MNRFFKYFLIAFVAQLLFAGFVLTTGLIFGYAIGDGVLFLLYVVPWIILFPQGFGEPVELSTLAFAISIVIPAAFYSLILSAALCIFRYRRTSENDLR